MRLICPNCGAQYEVDSGMIPDEGRDVQCSNCGQTWFQPADGDGVSYAPEAVEEDAPTEADAASEDAAEATEAPAPQAHEEPAAAEEELAAEPEPATPVASEFEAVVAEIQNTVEDEAEDTPAFDEDDVAEDDLPKPSDRLDENILGILREEAERETAARRSESATGLETQPDLGLPEDAADPESDDATADEDARAGVSAHVARMRGEDDDDGSPGARSDLLPDIEEINSSLRPASEHPEVSEVEDPVVVEAKRRGGFRVGFTLMILIASVLVLAYVFAPQIVQQVPAAEPIIILYVDIANSARDGIDSVMARSIESMTGGDAASE